MVTDKFQKSVLAEMCEKNIVKAHEMLMGIDGISLSEPKLISSIRDARRRIKNYRKRLNESNSTSNTDSNE